MPSRTDEKAEHPEHALCETYLNKQSGQISTSLNDEMWLEGISYHYVVEKLEDRFQWYVNTALNGNSKNF